MKTVEEILSDKPTVVNSQYDAYTPLVVEEAMKEYGKQLLEEYTNRIVENAKIEWSGSMVTGNVDKESITSQLPKFLKELE